MRYLRFFKKEDRWAIGGSIFFEEEEMKQQVVWRGAMRI